MNKAILVIDMPSGCEECPLAVEKTYSDMCCITGSRIISYGKFPWCPLKSLPEKYDMESAITRDFDDHGDYELGYNACIDEILGGQLWTK